MGFLEAEVVWRKNAWERRDYPTIMDGLVVRYRPVESYGRAQISASRNRVEIHDVALLDHESRRQFLDVLARAWRQFDHLARGGRHALPELDGAGELIGQEKTEPGKTGAAE